MVRSKVVCQRKDSDHVYFAPGSGSIPETPDLFKATLVGPIAFQTETEEALNQFEQGRSYYIDFSQAE